MALRIVQFLAVVLTALALVPAGAHLFSMPNKITLAQDQYFIAQSLYRGWFLFGIVLFGAVVANFATAMLVFYQGKPFALAGLAVLCIGVSLVIFFIWTYPANVATNNWTQAPRNWETAAQSVGVLARSECGDHFRGIVCGDALGAGD